MIKQKNFVFLLSSSTVVTIAWIGFSIYHTAVTSTLDPILTSQIKPIPPRFNDTTIRNIMNRQDVAPTYEITGGEVPIDTASPSAVPSAITPTPTLTPELTPEVTTTLTPDPTNIEIEGDELL